MTPQRSWSRFVALGDSFTEGIGDPDASSPGGHRGWADRVAEVLALRSENFSYANLAIRGRLLDAIVDEQVEPALSLRPDLITFSAGGNDLIRPNTDPDSISARIEAAVVSLHSAGATVVLFTGPDFGATPVLGRSRGKVAIFNENLRAIAVRHDAIIADLWAVRELKIASMWSPDRLHLSPIGHNTVARMVLNTLGVDHDLLDSEEEEAESRISWHRARVDDFDWAKEYLVPWVLRRVRHQSSGDGISAKRPIADWTPRAFTRDVAVTDPAHRRAL